MTKFLFTIFRFIILKHRQVIDSITLQKIIQDENKIKGEELDWTSPVKVEPALWEKVKIFKRKRLVLRNQKVTIMTSLITIVLIIRNIKNSGKLFQKTVRTQEREI